MWIDQVDLIWTYSGIDERGLHRRNEIGAIGQGRDRMVGAARGAITKKLGMDSGATPDGAGLSLQQQHGGTFTHDEAVAVFAEGAAGDIGRIVPDCHRSQAVETREDQW